MSEQITIQEQTPNKQEYSREDGVEIIVNKTVETFNENKCIIIAFIRNKHNTDVAPVMREIKKKLISEKEYMGLPKCSGDLDNINFPSIFPQKKDILFLDSANITTNQSDVQEKAIACGTTFEGTLLKIYLYNENESLTFEPEFIEEHSDMIIKLDEKV